MEVAWWWAGDRKKEPSLHFHDCVPTHQPPMQKRRHWRKCYHPGPMAAITAPLFFCLHKRKEGDKGGLVRDPNREKSKGIARCVCCGKRVKPEASSHHQHSTMGNRDEVKDGRECWLSVVSATFYPTP